jgi:glycosyltransferase involved in cell wall biosynthesis
LGKRIGKVRGCFTMFESDRIPWDFVYNVEKFFDFIIVPNDWCKGIFDQVFPDHQVYVSPLGINPDLFPYIKRPTNRKPFTFLWQGFRMADRKRFDLVLKAFDELNLPDARLICKTLGSANSQGATFSLSDSRHSYICEDYSHAELLDLYYKADFGIIPTEAEGVGMIPLEWMATGLPCAISNSTGCAGYCQEKVNYPLESTESHKYPDGGINKFPSLNSIKAAMGNAYWRRDEIAAKGERASVWIKGFHNSDLAARRLMQLLFENEFKSRAVA